MDSLKPNVDSTIDILNNHLDCWSELNPAETQTFQDLKMETRTMALVKLQSYS